MPNYSHDPDDPHGDEIVCALEIKVRRSGAMSVAGSINDERYALALLDAAKDSVRAYHRRQRGGRKDQLIVPAGEALQ